jgi:hypothetical protein
MALVGKLLKEPGCPRRKAFGERLPRFEACHGPFEQVEAPLDQVVFGFQAFDGFHGFSPLPCANKGPDPSL